MARNISKELPDLLKLYAKYGINSKKLKSIGQQMIPPILANDIPTPLKDRNLMNLKKGVDNLHNMTGVIKMIVDLERSRSDWNDTIFLSKLVAHVRPMDNSLLEVLIRLHCEEDVNRKTQTETSSEPEINVAYLKSKKFNELCIPADHLALFPKDVDAFICNLKSFGYVEGKDFMYQHGYLAFFYLR